MNPRHLPPAFRIIACSLLACFPTPFLAAQASEPESPAGGVLFAVQALVDDNKRDEALAKLQDAIREPGVEPDHPAVATLHIAKARILRHLGRHGEAATAAAAAAAIYEKAMGANNLFAMNARWTAASEAMSANQPAKAATSSAALLKTYYAYLNSGAAERAQWNSVPQAAALFKEMPAFNEAGVAEISALLGRALAAAGETEKALPVLREAAASLERLHGRGHPELVDLTEVLERIAAKRGEALGQRYVGSLGYFGKLVFEGNSLIPADALRSGLTRDVEAVYASHPAADLADFLATLAKQLTGGYLNSGFPEAKVEALLERREDGSRILVRIHEGPRFLKGRILVEGATTIPAAQLREMLLPKEDTPKGPSLIAQVREIMTDNEKLLPKPDSKAAEEMVEALNQQTSAFKWQSTGGNPAPVDDGLESLFGLGGLQKTLSSSSLEADWTPGKPVKFSQDRAEPLTDSVRRRLADLGHPLVRFHTSYRLNPDGTGDLIIRIEDEGPLAVIGRIQVVGAKAHRPEEIIAACGLAGGRPFTPEVLDQAMLALWETGRFFPFSITPVPRAANAREVDLLLQTREITGVARLDAKLSPEQEVARRFIRNFNQWMTSGTDDELLVTADAGNGVVVTAGFSASAGLVLDTTSPDGAIRATASVASDCIRIRLQRENRNSVIHLPLPMDRFKATLQLLPDPETGKGWFSSKIGFSSLASLNGLPSTIVTISPAVPLIKPHAFRRAGERFVEYVENDRVILRLDATTAMPVSTADTRIEFRKGAVTELQQSIAAELGRPGAGGGLADWVEGARTLARLADENDMFEGLFAQPEIQRWLDFAAALAKPDITKPFADLWAKWSDAAKDRETFSIPLDPASLQRAGAINLLVSFGAVGLAEMVAPPDSWVAKLAREVVFIQGGNTRYTARTMKELLDDPTMGPYGCLLAARVMARYDAASAVRFLHKARTQANSASFRHDWKLVLDSPTGIGQAVTDTLAALGSIPPQQEAELTAPLDPAQAAWLRDFLGAIRSRPVGGDLSEWLAPHMDKLWDRLLRENFLKYLEDTLNPPTDPTLIAATVDGMPVSRAWMKKLDDGGFYRVLLPPLPPDPARPWTQRPLLAETIRLMLWKKSWAAGAATVLPADAAAAGSDLTPEDFQRIVGEATALLRQMPEPADGELAKWWRQHGPVLGRQCHLHTIRTTADDEQPDTLNRSTRLVRAAAAHVRDGLPLAALAAAAAKDKTCALTTSCDQDTLLVDMRPEFSQSLKDLKPGEMSSIVGLKTLRWAAILVGWNDTPPPPLDDARDTILTAWQSERIASLLQQKLAPLERAADIRVLEDPAPAAAPESVFQQILKDSPDSPVARLGGFWDQVLAKDPKAGNALDPLLATRALDPSSLTQLEKALRNRGLTELADRAKAAAAEK